MFAFCTPLTGDLVRNPGMCPWLGIEPATLCFAGWCSVHWATSARANSVSRKQTPSLVPNFHSFTHKIFRAHSTWQAHLQVLVKQQWAQQTAQPLQKVTATFCLSCYYTFQPPVQCLSMFSLTSMVCSGLCSIGQPDMEDKAGFWGKRYSGSNPSSTQSARKFDK